MDLFERFYNIAAHMIREILEKTDDKFFERYSALNRETRETINDCLEQEFPELFLDKQPVEILAGSRYDDKFFQRLKKFSASRGSEQELQCMVCLLSKLDIGLSKRIENFSTSKEIQALNSNVEEVCVQLLPRCICSWEHKSRGSSYVNCLSNYLKYFFYIDLNEVNGYQIFHLFLEPDTFAAAKERKFLQVGISPLTNQGRLRWYPEERDGIQYFSVDGVDNEEIAAENLLSILEEARQEQVDILCFPEMLGSRHIYGRAAGRLSQFLEDDRLYPSLTVLPTIWEKHHNRAVVLNEIGDEVIQQEKQHGFLFPDEKSGEKYLEDIQPEKQIHLIHCQGVGRMAILICKDALMIRYLQMLLNVLKVTLLLIPSFSTGNHDFQEVIECCRSADCAAFWINTCSVQQLAPEAGDKLELIGFALITGKYCQPIRNGIHHCKRSRQRCLGSDNGDCSRCLYIHRLQF